MSTSRRDFIKQAAILSGIGATELFPESIRRAMAIEPQPGTTFLDAEHIVILMQENRSFDHTFGTLRGVRRVQRPSGDRTAQRRPRVGTTGHRGESLPSLPAKHQGHEIDLDGLSAAFVDEPGRCQKRWPLRPMAGCKAAPTRKVFAGMPLTLGYYTREDIPFYYALADAFTVCDQNFCSCLTGTTANRLHLWTGTIRAKQSSDSFAHVFNEDVDYGRWASWPTFPERLEDLGVSWRIYQNELSFESGLEGEQDAWLANFTDNPIEWFAQSGVRFAATHREYILKRLRKNPRGDQRQTGRSRIGNRGAPRSREE